MKRSFPFNDFWDFKEDKSSIFLSFSFLPTLPSPHELTLLSLSRQTSDLGGKQLWDLKCNTAAAAVIKVFPFRYAWQLNNVNSRNSHKNTKLHLALKKIQSFLDAMRSLRVMPALLPYTARGQSYLTLLKRPVHFPPPWTMQLLWLPAGQRLWFVATSPQVHLHQHQ